MKLQSSFTWGRKRGAGTVAAALLIGGSLLGTQLASAAGRVQPRAVTFPSYTATAINDASGIPTALNVNNSGAVVGYLFPNGNGPFTAFIRTGTALTALPGLGTGNTFAFNANNLGDAVGDSRATGTGKAHAILWRSSDRQHPVDLSSALGLTDGESHALAINDAGDIAGVIGALGGSGSAFFLSHTGTLTVIGPGQANAVNNAANPQVAVMETTGADSQAGIWDAQNGFQPAPIAHSQGIRINDLGVLLGRASATVGGSMNNPFIWSAGQASVHPLGFTGRAGGINNAASPTVVGNDANGPVLWKEDTMVSLSSLLANANQVDVDSATGINDSGKISATGFSGSWLFSPGSATHADLQVTLTSAQPEGTAPTNPVDFTATIKNFGPDTASSVQVTPVINGQTLPAIAFPTAITSGQTVESHFRLTPSIVGVTGGTFIGTVNVTSDGIEPSPDTHSNSASTTVTVSGGTTTLTLQTVTVTPNPVQVPKPASVVLTFSGNIPTSGVNVTLQVTGVPVVGTYSKEFTGVHADTGKPRQATLTFDTSQLASVVTAPIQVHANAVYNGVTTNGPTVTVNPAGPPAALPAPIGLSLEPTIKVAGFKIPAVLAPQPIQVTVKLKGKAPSDMTVEGHLVVNGEDTSFSIPVAAGATTGTASVPTVKFLLMTAPASGEVTVKSGGVTYPKTTKANIVIFPLTLTKADYTVTPNGQTAGKVTALLTFSAPVPDAGVDVTFNGLFLNNKTVHVFPTASGSKTASVEISTSEVLGYVKGNLSVKYNSTTLTSPLTVGVLAIQSISLDKTVLDGTSGVVAMIQFNGILDKKATVLLDFPGILTKPVSVKLAPGKSSYPYSVSQTVVKGLVALSPAGDTSHTVTASSTAVPGTATFTFTVHKP